ncbi:tyrosine-protein phosphatase non-receptor type substrate 1-like [Liolophura sinensis]|uniref:tyrosine-protein phosphatase non-receptor type substrate 1-like n=1 Tax=Liolophura sinensis TaxID=3198878 RepID=UPI003158B343
MDGKDSLLTILVVGLVVFNVTTVTGQGVTNITLTPVNNGHLGSELMVDCVFTYTDVSSIVRKVHFYRKRRNEPNFSEIANADSQASPDYRWNDTALQSRSDFNMVNRTFFRITIRDLECRDKAEYRCMYFVGNREGEVFIPSGEKALDISAPPSVPDVTYSPSEIVENEPVQFTCTGNVGLPAGSLQLYLVKSNGQEIDMNADQGIEEVVANGCTFERRATANHNLTFEDDARSRVGCRVLQTYADENQHFSLTEKLAVQYSPRDTVMYRSVDNKEKQKIGVGQTVEVPVQSNVDLSCETRSNPPALYEWSYMLKGTNDTVTESPTSSGRFRLDSISLQKSGEYRCTVTNIIRNVTHKDDVYFKLNVSSIPTIPPTEPTAASPSGGTEPGKTTTTSKTGETKETSQAGVIGGAVGGALAAVIIIIIIIVCVVKRNKNNKERIEEPSDKPRNNMDIPKVVVHPHMVSTPDKFDKYNKAFDKNEKELEYADLKFDDTPRSRKPVQILYEPTNYAEVAWPRV